MGHSVWCQMERLGHVFSIHHNFECSPPPAPILFDISLPLILSGVPQTSLVARAFGAEGVNGGYISFTFFSLFSSIKYDINLKKNSKFLRCFISLIKPAQFCSFVEGARTWSEVISIHPLGTCFTDDNTYCCFLGIGCVYSGDSMAR